MSSYLSVCLLASVCLVVLVSAFPKNLAPWKPQKDNIDIKPWQMSRSEEAVNMCLMACAMCFDSGNADELLMECANSQCLNLIKHGETVDDFWTKQCPHLSKIWGKRE